jgi:putative membrane protein
MKIIADWLVSAVSLVLVSRFVSGIHFADFVSAILAAVIIGLVNLLVKPLIVLFTLPITILTFGLFTFVINAFVFQIASRVTPGFTIDSFWAALIGSLVYAILNSLLHKIARV